MNFVNAEPTKISINTYVTAKISFAKYARRNLRQTFGDGCRRNYRGHRQRWADWPQISAWGNGIWRAMSPQRHDRVLDDGKRLGIEASLAAATHVISERQVERLVTIIAEYTEPGDPGCNPWSFA